MTSNTQTNSKYKGYNSMCAVVRIYNLRFLLFIYSGVTVLDMFCNLYNYDIILQDSLIKYLLCCWKYSDD